MKHTPATAKPIIHNEGLIVIERDSGGGFLLMTPHGDIKSFSTKAAAERYARAWFAKHSKVDAFNVGRIEWRTS